MAGAGSAASCSLLRAAGKHLLQRVVRSVQLPSPAGCGPHGGPGLRAPGPEMALELR